MSIETIVAHRGPDSRCLEAVAPPIDPLLGHLVHGSSVLAGGRSGTDRGLAGYVHHVEFLANRDTGPTAGRFWGDAPDGPPLG